MPTRIFVYADRAIGGQLASLLQTWRDEGLSDEKIARRLDAEYDIDVTGRTITKWFLDIASEAAEAEETAAS